MTTVEPQPVESKADKNARLVHERFLARQAKEAKAEAIKEAKRNQVRQFTEDNPRRERPHVFLRTQPEQIEAVTDALNLGVIPEIYVAAGQPVVVEVPSGVIRDRDAPRKIFSIIGPNRLRRMLATHTFTYRMVNKSIGGGESVSVEEEELPTLEICKDVLATLEWPKMRPLYGIASAPFFRPDGRLVQEPGYDEATGLIFEPLLDIAAVSERPTREQLHEARTFILVDLLGDFPWVDHASKSNFVAMLVAPLMRTFLDGALVPMGAIDAKTAATGKTLLCMIVTRIYSGFTRAWTDDDVELRKAITSILLDKGGAAVVLDNVPKGTQVDSATLAALLTMRTWSDRELGSNSAGSAIRVPNDRTWFLTGNNLTVAGDNRSRALLSQLDAKMPNPELRPTSKFKLGDLEQWLEAPENRAQVLHCLLVLMRGWIVDGAPAIETPMRTFTPWASASHGFIDWLGMKDFAANSLHMAAMDPEELMWAAFYASWWRLFGDAHVTASTLVASATPDEHDMTKKDWGDTFLRNKIGRIPAPSGLGRIFTSEIGSWHGEFELKGEADTHTKVWSFWLSPRPAEDAAAGDAAAGDAAACGG